MEVDDGTEAKASVGEGRGGWEHLRELHCGTCGVGRCRCARLERSKSSVATCSWCWRWGGGWGDRVSVLATNSDATKEKKQTNGWRGALHPGCGCMRTESSSPTITTRSFSFLLFFESDAAGFLKWNGASSSS